MSLILYKETLLQSIGISLLGIMVCVEDKLGKISLVLKVASFWLKVWVFVKPGLAICEVSSWKSLKATSESLLHNYIRVSQTRSHCKATAYWFQLKICLYDRGFPNVFSTIKFCVWNSSRSCTHDSSVTWAGDLLTWSHREAAAQRFHLRISLEDRGFFNLPASRYHVCSFERVS